MHIKLERMCVACRQKKSQHEMLRISRLNDGYILDLHHKLNGRGAYICKTKECINTTIKKKLLNKAFKTNLDASIYQKIGDYEENN